MKVMITDGHEGHHHEGVDPHIWLGPTQALVIANALSETLSAQDPANAERYRANLLAFKAKVEAKDKVIAEQMKAVNQKGYFVFHEAYGYWERHYGMSSKGHFTVSPERRPGAKTLVEIRKALEEKKASCIYAEPQFSPAVIESVARNTGAKVLLLDEVGEQQKIELVNNYFNNLTYSDDPRLWGEADYWANPLEFIGARGGDCEDYSISKYYTLMELGVDEKKLRLAYVKAVRYNQFHMVTLYFATPKSDPLVLDNINSRILPGSKRTDLIPVYSFDAKSIWIMKSRREGTLAGSADRLA
ncbi:UNVERIFIED_CONTAM: hypothetical protein K2H54_000175 [Gekko kuhli]